MQKENSYNKLYLYFKQIAEKSNLIKGFAGYFERDLSNQEQSYKGISSPYLALWNYEKGYEGENSNTIAIISVGYVILRNDIPIDDIEAQYQAIDSCEQIAKSVNSRLWFDNNDRNHLLYNAFIKEKTRIIPIDMEGVGFGVQVEVFFKNPENLKLNPDDWSDVDSIC